MMSHMHCKCQKNPHAPLGKMPVANAPGQLVAADLIGPLVKSNKNNSYILTILDHASCWAEAFPIPSKTSMEVWKRLTKDYFPRHGYPKVLLQIKVSNSEPISV